MAAAVATRIALALAIAVGDAAAATVPFTLDHNRMILEVEFVRADGTVRTASAWVDTGNEVLMLAQPLARELGYDVAALETGERSVDLPAPPSMRVCGLPLPVDGVKTRAFAGRRVLPGVPAEANLPASLLRNERVIFDYPAGLFSIARPGTSGPRGVPIPCRVNAETGLFMIPVTAGGDTLPFGVDNGSAGTWVSDSLTTRWASRNPEWPRATGAAGSANFFGFGFEAGGALMRLPEIMIGSARARDIAVLGLDQRMFDWYSGKSAGAVSGFIGANVLKAFRLEVDFPNRMTYWEAGASPDPGDLDIVGLTLRPEVDGGYTIAGVVSKDGKPAIEGVEPGDRLIRVDEMEVADATMGAVADALRGAPGATRLLVIQRKGESSAIEAKVLRLP
jgi:hypothetical protein